MTRPCCGRPASRCYPCVTPECENTTAEEGEWCDECLAELKAWARWYAKEKDRRFLERMDREGLKGDLRLIETWEEMEESA